MPARFCTECGHATQPYEEGGRTRARCASCGHVDYGNPSPAVGAILVRDGKVLLSRRARPPHAGLWDLPGGFMEAGESAEEAILRELREETGLHARILHLVHTAPGAYHGRPTLNLVYLCDADGEPFAHDDSAELRWTDPTRLPQMAFPHEMDALRRWLDHRAA